MHTIEAVLFKLNEGVKREVFLQDAAITQSKIEAFKGYIKRQLNENEDGQWLDLVWWESEADALAAAEIIMQDNACAPFMAAIDESSVQIFHLAAVDLGNTGSGQLESAQALEVVLFKPRAEVSHNEIVASSRSLQTLLLSKQGYLYRQLWEKDNQWLDLVWWQSLELAQQAAVEVAADESLAPQFAVFMGGEMQMLHFNLVPVKTMA